MPISRDAIRRNAVAFSERWQGKQSEKSEGQSFVRDFLAVFGLEDAAAEGTFEKPSGGGFADYLLPRTIAIEMKSKGKNLDDAYQQLLDYVVSLPDSEIPDLLMVSDFENIVLYQRTAKSKKQRTPIAFKTSDLCDYVDHFHYLAGLERHYEIDEQYEVNVQAAMKMANLHDDLERLGYEGHVLEVYLVRLLFCLFAEDTGIFPQDSFLSYVVNSKEDGSDLSGRIVRLFDVLDMPDETRAKRTQLPPDLREFRYIDGGLFKEPLPPADFDAKMRLTLIDCCKFDWSAISPAIFGAMFQGIMNRDLRREIGAHYTDEENILKLINPLFMDDLRAELNRIKNDKRRLDDFHEKIANLKFLDPACGCGNFLMIAYRELRLLEIEVVRIKKSKMKKADQKVLDISMLLKVNVEQFYGIEILEFPCEVARTGMWLIDHLMNRVASKELGQYYIRLPLTQSATMVHANALRLNWGDIVSKQKLSYIIGNPPYGGHQFRTTEQQLDMKIVYQDSNKFGKLDYVCCWYQKAVAMMKGATVRTAFVSTNSIVQGESVAVLWKPIFEQGIEISFAYAPFVWTSEAKGKAAVHCVIIALTRAGEVKSKHLYSQNAVTEVNNINGYLLPASSVYIQSRGKPLTAGMPEMSKGSQPTDGGHLILSVEEREELITQHPQTTNWIKQYISAEDFINNRLRYCLWLKGVAPSEYRSIKPIMKRLESVSEMRKASPTASVQRDADMPMLFTQIRQPRTRYLVVPEVSSERRKYIPIGYMEPDIIASNMVYIISDATLYMFGIMMSSTHMAWTRVVCGRLEMRYRYTPAVYNNFPWPEATDAQKTHIETLAQAVLDARAMHPDSSLADLYDPLTMPPELLKAHQSLDRAVMKLYGFKKDLAETGIVAALMIKYQEILATEKHGKARKMSLP